MVIIANANGILNYFQMRISDGLIFIFLYLVQNRFQM